MKASELLRIAVRDHLREYGSLRGYSNYLCVALMDADAALNTREASDAHTRARTRIEGAIAPYHTLENWLWAQGISYGETTSAQMYEYRKRWAEHLAQEFEKEGD